MSNRPHTRPRRKVKTLRRVWAALSETPGATYGELVRRLHLSQMTVFRATHALRDAGYIAFDDGKVNARTVIVPFIVVKKAKA